MEELSKLAQLISDQYLVVEMAMIMILELEMLRVGEDM